MADKKKHKDVKKGTPKAKIEKFNKEDLYHDIEDEKHKKIKKKHFYKELEKLDVELIKLQEWIKAKKLRVVVIFEGRDAAGKGDKIMEFGVTEPEQVAKIRNIFFQNNINKSER